MALLAFLEATKLQRIILALGADVVDEQIIVGDLVSALCVIPEPPDCLDELAVMVDQHVIDGDHLMFVQTVLYRVLAPEGNSPLTCKIDC